MRTNTREAGRLAAQSKLGPQRDRRARIHVLQAGLIACYEIIDRIRKELAELGTTK